MGNLANQLLTRKDIGNHLYFFKTLDAIDVLYNDQFLGVFNGSGLISLVRYLEAIKPSDSEFEILLDFVINACRTSMIYDD